jgi:hypothetical protein
MFTYQITIPNLGTYEVSSPSELTDEQAYQAVLPQAEKERQRLLSIPYSMEGVTPEMLAEQEPVNIGPVGRKAVGFIKGNVVDPIEAAIQMFGGEEARRGVTEREASYQEMRKRLGEEGIEGSRLLGAVASPTGIAAGLGAAKALAQGGKAIQALGAGTASALTQPVTGEQAIGGAGFAQEKAEQAGFGAAFGLGGYFLGKALTPKVKEGVDELISQGIPISPGQAYEGVPGWFFRQVESFDIPYFRVNKDAINRQFTKAVGNEVLSSVNAKVSPNARTGVDVFKEVHQQIKNVYDDALSKIPPTNADKLLQNVNSGVELASSQLSTTRKAREFQNVIKANVFNKIKDGNIDGESLKKIESFLRKKSSSIKAIDSDADAMRSGYDEILKTVKGFIQEVDSTGNIAKANEAWMKRARFKSAVEKSLAEVPGETGTVTPRRMLQESARQGEGAQAALGTAPMQRQATQAFDIVGETKGEATKYRNLLIAGKITGLGLYGIFNPAIALPIFTASGLSYKTAEKLLQSPNFRNALNQAIEKIGPSEVARIAESIRMQSNAQE